MARSPLHDEVIAIADKKGAMVISSEILRNAALDSLIRASRFARDAKVIFPSGHKAVAVRFVTVSIDPDKLYADLEERSGNFGLRIGPPFDLVIELFYPDDPSLTYATVEVAVPELWLPLEPQGKTLRFGITPDAPVTATVTSDKAQRAKAIAASGISNEDLLRIEGSIAFGSATRLVVNALGILPAIDLEVLFPAFAFSGKLTLFRATNSLVVVPERFELIGNIGCPQGDGAAGLGIIPQDPTTTGPSRSWPMITDVPPLQARRAINSDALVAAYLPKQLLDVHFGKVAPAVTYRDHGDGFIGYDVELSSAIRGVAVTIDPVKFGIRLKLDFATWGLLVATVDVPCVGRVDLAQARFEMPLNNGTADVEVLLRFAVDTGGQLLVVSDLAACNLGTAKVSVQLFSKYLGLAGGEAAVTGFILDAVIGKIISNNLPGLVFDAIKAAVNQHFFVLADIHNLIKYLRNKPNLPGLSADLNSILVGPAYQG